MTECSPFATRWRIQTLNNGSPTSPYSTSVYENTVKTSRASAREVVPVLIQLFSPKSVVDVGCGRLLARRISGTWGRHRLRGGMDPLRRARRPETSDHRA